MTTTCCPTPTLRELGPRDAHVLDAVFDGLSPTSRYLRFHGAVARLSRSVRERLAAVDGRTHIAVAAFVDGAPVGIARLVTYHDGPPGRVELAVEVVDDWHGRGIGTRLVRAVAELGRAAGHTEVVAEVLAGNAAVRSVLFATFPNLTSSADGPEITYRAPLAAA